MKVYLTKMIVAGQSSVIINYGDKIWAWVECSTNPGDVFSIRSIRTTCPALSHLTDRSQHDFVKVTLMNILKRYEHLEGCPIKRISLLRFKRV